LKHARVTIKDVANHAGVSTATVSYVINQSRYVSPELTEKVLKAVEELCYKPDHVARSLRQQQSRTLGLIVPDSANPFFAEIAKGVEDAGFDAGYSVIICNSNMMLERELAYLNLLQSKRVDAIIFIATTTEIEQIRPIVDRGIPVAIFYRHPGGLNVDSFRVDNLDGGYQATKHLLELGHEKIACIQPASDKTPSGRRVLGYIKALEEHGIAVDERLMPVGNNLVDGGQAAANNLIGSGSEFTAIFACNDAMAIGAIHALCRAGFRVPEDVSIVGFDDIKLASYTVPPLTTIASPKEDAGRMAVEYLLERIRGAHDAGPREVTLEIELVVRESTVPRS